MTKSDQRKCFSCGLEHPDVEGSGMWGCPNPYCQGAGGAWFRAKLKSHKEVGDKHEVDEDEYRREAKEYLRIKDDLGWLVFKLESDGNPWIEKRKQNFDT